MIRVGMSGFSYPSWKPDFYPKGTKADAMLTSYATRFNAVEINVSFRRAVPEETLDKWQDATPGDFRFAMKAHQVITHYRRLVGAERNVEEVTDRARYLKDRLGVVFFQTRANLKFDPEILEAFCASLPTDLRYAFEPRHESFETTACEEILRKYNVARCANDEVHDPLSYVATSDVAYLRFHREEPYSADDLKARADAAQRLACSDVYAFFRHTDDVACVRPALTFRELTSA